MNEKPFNWGLFIAGILIAGFVGFFANLAAGFGALAVQNPPFGAVIGALPGLIMGFIGYRVRRRGGMGEGLLAGACVVALIGGICGGSLGGGLDFK